MARRRSTTTATGGNFDSMLDTLMNVVGILVMILVAVQISSQEAAIRIADEATKIDPQEVVRLEEALEKAKQHAVAAAEALREQQQAAKDPKKELSKLESQFRAEDDRARQAAARAASLEKARAAAQAAALEAADKMATERAHKEAARNALVERLTKLREEFANLPVLEAPPTKEVRLPDPRPAPANVKEIHVLCREQKIWLVDIPALQEKAQKRADFVIRSKKLDPDNDHWIADGKTLLDEFNRAPVKDGGFEITLGLLNGRWPRLVLTRMKGHGETADDAVKASGDYARALRRLAPDANVLRFFVWPDSFEAYLKVRDFAGDRGYAAGWEPMTAPDEHLIPLGKYGVGEKPAKPAEPSKPPPPKNVLD